MPETWDIDWTQVITIATTVGGYLLAFLLIPRIILDRRESGATLAWILFIAIVPWLGAALFFLVGRTRVRRRTKKRHRSRAAFQRSLEQLPDSPEACDFDRPPKELPESSKDIARLADAVADVPIIGGNAVEVYIDANHAYDSMQAAIEAAEHHVFLQSYIYRADAAGRRFRDLLIERARAGVEVATDAGLHTGDAPSMRLRRAGKSEKPGKANPKPNKPDRVPGIARFWAFSVAGVAVVLLHPGMVATEMTGGRGISADESAKGLIARIDALELTDTGSFHHQDGRRLEW